MWQYNWSVYANSLSLIYDRAHRMCWLLYIGASLPPLKMVGINLPALNLLYQTVNVMYCIY